MSHAAYIISAISFGVALICIGSAAARKIANEYDFTVAYPAFLAITFAGVVVFVFAADYLAHYFGVHA